MQKCFTYQGDLILRGLCADTWHAASILSVRRSSSRHQRSSVTVDLCSQLAQQQHASTGHPEAKYQTKLPGKPEGFSNRPVVQQRALTLQERKALYTRKSKGGNFTDAFRAQVQGGQGGHGGVSFYPSSRNAHDRPHGGNGGLGGSIYLVADPCCNDLRHLRAKYKAGNGSGGGPEFLHGKNGADIDVPVPLGTIVSVLKYKCANLKPATPVQPFYDDGGQLVFPQPESDESDDTQGVGEEEGVEITLQDIRRFIKEGPNAYEEFIKDKKAMRNRNIPVLARLDLDTYPMRVRVSTGGRGGQGNAQLSRVNGNISTKEFEHGLSGSLATLQLDLKLIADIGLIGLPNAGKSSFLAGITRARPTIAHYPFTTLNPTLGTLPACMKKKSNAHWPIFQYAAEYPPLTVADIPGLIEGAHLDIGLGHSFLAHISRTKALLYILDMNAESPWHDYIVLRNELCKYDPHLLTKDSLVIANKSDLASTFDVNYGLFMQRLNEAFDDNSKESTPYVKPNVIKVSAKFGTGLEEAMMAIRILMLHKIA